MDVPSSSDEDDVPGVRDAGLDGPLMAAPAPAPPISFTERRTHYGASPDAERHEPRRRRAEHCITGHAQKITYALIRYGHAFSERDLTFLAHLTAETFQKAGWLVESGGEPDRCRMTLHGWTKALGWRPSGVCNERARLVSLGVITWEPDVDAPGEGTLAWNLSLDDWLPLRADHRQARYARLGARAGVAGAIEQESITGLTAYPVDAPSGAEIAPQTRNDSTSNAQRSPATYSVKPITLAPPEAAQEAESPSKLKNLEREEAFKNPDVAIATAAPSADASVKVNRSSSSRPRKITDPDKQQAWATEADYRAQLIKGIEELVGHKSTVKEREWKAAGWFYRDAPNAPAPREDVLAFYEAARRDPRWATRDPSLISLKDEYLVWLRNRDAFRESIEAKRRRTEAVSDPTRAQKGPTTYANQRSSAQRPTREPPNPSAHGKYAHLFQRG